MRLFTLSLLAPLLVAATSAAAPLGEAPPSSEQTVACTTSDITCAETTTTDVAGMLKSCVATGGTGTLGHCTRDGVIASCVVPDEGTSVFLYPAAMRSPS
jgi:hypothetical protein